MSLIDLAERGWLPDAMIRYGIRRLLRRRVRIDARFSADEASRQAQQFAAGLRQGPLAIATDAANEQHYEVPAGFYQRMLGPRLKYSCCLYDDQQTSLGDAEEAMLKLTCQRADLADGQHVLELGCGWGSLTLWMAEQYPASEITAVSNSRSQREFIQQQCASRGLTNVEVITADMRDFDIDQQFDRVVSVEMFEHMQNYELLLRRISNWLTPQGKLFVHIFCRRHLPYLFETDGADNWMGRHFFTGGVMPSFDLFSHFADDLAVSQSWKIDGIHYARTCDDWLTQLDQQRRDTEALFERDMSRPQARITVQRWRMFVMACAELFRHDDGKEWFVGHYLFEHARKVEPSSSSVLVGT
mgnify:CR=1 FL=1